MSPTRNLLDMVRQGVRVYDLGRPLFAGMPQSPNHPTFSHAMPRRHGDVVRASGASAANDIVVMGTHVGTHVDALAHVSDNGRLHGGLDASEQQVGGRFLQGGAHQIAPMVCRGALLDIPRLLGLDTCPVGYEITPDDLQGACDQQGVSPEHGDVVLLRSGWGSYWNDRDVFVGTGDGTPGVGEDGAHWLADRGVQAAGADTIAFEHVPAGQADSLLLAHRVLLVEAGIHIIEKLDLEALSAEHVHEFVFVMSPLAIVGATGAPVRPLAVVEAED